MSRGRKCSDCDYYRRHLDFNHDTCLDHRPCITRSGYEPALCDACNFNRGSWDPFSRRLTLWRRELFMHSNRMGGAGIWPFEASFSAFFEVVLASGSDAGSRSRDRSPHEGRGSRAASPLPRARSPARSSASRPSRSPRSAPRVRVGHAAGSRPRASPRGSSHRSRSPLRRSGDRLGRSGVSHDRSGVPDPPAGPSVDSPPAFSDSLADELRAYMAKISSLIGDTRKTATGGASRPSAAPSGEPSFTGFSQDHARSPRRRRARILSPSPSFDSDSDDTQSASLAHAAGGRASDPEDSPSPSPRNLGFQDLKPHTFTGTHNYFYFHPDLEVEDGRGVFLDGAWRAITRHPTAAAFRLNTSGATRDLLISANSAVDAVRRVFAREPLDRIKVGSASRSFSYPMEALPLMQSLLQVLHDRDRALVKAVLDREFSTFSKHMDDFKPLVGMVFSDSWSVCPSFEAFAKPKLLNPGDDSLHLMAQTTPFVPTKLLTQESEKRAVVVDFLSSLAMLFKLAASLEGSNQMMSHLAYTAIRGLLPAFQLALFSWISIKTDCRKIFLQGSASPFAFTLLSSSPWTPSLFPVDVIVELVKSPALLGRPVMEALGWTEYRHKLLQRRQKDLDPRLPGLLPGSAGGARRRRSAPPSRRDYAASASPFRPAKRGRWDSRSQRGAKKPFRGSRGSRGARGASTSAKGSASGQRQA